jgi:16S rRNA (cytosine1402-N4)-methyltransferase
MNDAAEIGNAPLNPEVRPKRRVRYQGTHPRQFHEKYKELNPEKFPELIQKVTASGKTPAGMHRPICVQEILNFFQPADGQVEVDCTLGFGGHAMAILPKLLPSGKLIGIDTDPIELPKTEQRFRNAGFTENQFVARHSNFAGIQRILGELGLPGADLILADLGVSSMQLDTPERGFSFKQIAPLDLRMNPQKGRSAAEYLKSCRQEDLLRCLQVNADEPSAARIAEEVCSSRERTAIKTTKDFAEVVRAALGQRQRPASKAEMDACIRRCFQALRIEVNDEFGALDNFLRVLPSCLNTGGRVAILTFHSGEDRRVKQAFEAGARSGIYDLQELIRPSAAEIGSNPRASSAKLRCAVKCVENTPG